MRKKLSIIFGPVVTLTLVIFFGQGANAMNESAIFPRGEQGPKEFFTNTTNILLVQSFHTSGGFTYRPFARWPDSRIAAEDLAVFDQVMGPKYKELHPDEEDQDRLWRPPYRGDRP